MSLLLVASLTVAAMVVVAFKIYQAQKEQTKTETKIEDNAPKKQVNTLLTDPKKADKPGDF
jgi:cell division protein FtsL